MVMTNIEVIIILDGKGFFKTRTERNKLTRGVQRFIAPYIGIFIPNIGTHN